MSGQSLWGSDEALRDALAYLEGAISLSREAIERVSVRGGALNRCVCALGCSANETASSAVVLLRGLRARDAWILGRATFETTLNVAFVCADPDMAERAHRHALQKAARDLERESSIGGSKFGVRYTGIPDELPVEVQSALNEYTSRKGTEIRDWSGKSVDERIEAVGEVLGEDLAMGFQFPLLMFYRHGSELVHGTLFGALWSLGWGQPRNDDLPGEQAAAVNRREMAQAAMLMSGACMDLLIQSVGRKFELGDFPSLSSELIRGLRLTKADPGSSS